MNKEEKDKLRKSNMSQTDLLKEILIILKETKELISRLVK